MKSDPDIYTETMAGVYAQQGHWDRAAEIYRRLVQREPHRRDLVQALANAEKNAAGSGAGQTSRLVPLFQQWIALLLEYEKLQKLRKLQKR